MAFRIFKKKKNNINLDIFAPVNGNIIPNTEVPDPVFSEKMMGEGVAFIPADGMFRSPINGKVVQVFPTHHAIGLVTDCGTEILIHIGLETVALEGKGFSMKVEEGDEVTVGQLLVEVELDYIEKHASSTITPMVITNSINSNKAYTITEDTEGSAGETLAITVSAN